MSWDSYRDTLVASGSVEKAAMCGMDGGIWSQSPGFNLTPNEVKLIISAFLNPDTIRANGINLGGKKYIFIQADESQIQGKMGTEGISIAKSGMCVIIGTYNESIRHENCRIQIEKIRDYLQSSGF